MTEAMAALSEAADAVRTHVSAWTKLLATHAAGLPEDRIDTAEEAGTAERGYAEHELAALRRDLPPLVAAADAAIAQAAKPALRWLAHSDDFASLMLGRIEIAQASKARSSGTWFLSLRFCEASQNPNPCAPSREGAEAIAEAHARDVLA